MSDISPGRIAELMQREEARFAEEHPASERLHARGKASLLDGVPMNWMTQWPSAFPPVLRRTALGQRLYCVDRLRLRGSVSGRHRGNDRPLAAETVRAMTDQVDARTARLMLPTEDSICSRRGAGEPLWAPALAVHPLGHRREPLQQSAWHGRSPAARASSIYNHCYHGTVDETVIDPPRWERRSPRAGDIGPPVRPSDTTRDRGDERCGGAGARPSPTSEVARDPGRAGDDEHRDRPWPSRGFHDAFERLSRAKPGTLLDHRRDSHPLLWPRWLHGRAWPGAWTSCHWEADRRRSPDRRVRLQHGRSRAGQRPHRPVIAAHVGGIGGTLAGNALSLAAARATLAPRS